LPLLSLEISRGRTQFRRRPVWSKRFLIGGGEGCHLRLGGGAMPALHSIVLVEANDIWLDAIADVPPLFVNGEMERSVRLTDGDTIRIASFEFVVRQSPAAAAREAGVSVAESSQSELTGSIIEAPEPDPANLSATELVSLLERDEKLLEEFETSRRLGAAALLQAIAQRSERPQIAGRIPAPKAASSIPQLDADLLDELEEVIRRLNHCSDQLDRRAACMSPDELRHSETASALIEAQKSLDAQLQRVLARLAALDSGNAGPMRASA
jgi:hypothetical protein